VSAKRKKQHRRKAKKLHRDPSQKKPERQDVNMSIIEKGRTMGFYSEYLDRKLTFPELSQECKKQLKKISEERGGRDVLVFAADLNKTNAGQLISINYSDLLPINDQLSNLSGSAIDVILETPGGSGEVAEDIVRLLRSKYPDIGIIVPGYAKSAGTIIAMAGDEILMESGSALGPIDAQLFWMGKVFSAGELLDGMEKIKDETAATGVLNKAFIPILQGISPGELQRARNAQDFSKKLVADWLAHYKFKNWDTHSSTNQPVTPDEKRERAEKIATKLCDHSYWLTHGRSIKIEDLEQMQLKITDYSKAPVLAEAIRRYYTLLQLIFASNVYKVFETPTSQIHRYLVPQAAIQGPAGNIQVSPMPKIGSGGGLAKIEIVCGNCKNVTTLQANIGKAQPLKPGNLPFPQDNVFRCPKCNTEHNLSDLRRQLEGQSKQPVVA
jgi:hypothetical protein